MPHVVNDMLCVFNRSNPWVHHKTLQVPARIPARDKHEHYNCIGLTRLNPAFRIRALLVIRPIEAFTCFLLTFRLKVI